MTDQRVSKLARVLVRFSRSVKRGQKVLIAGPSAAEPLILELGREVDLGRLDLREAMEELIGEGRRTVLDGAGESVLTAHCRQPLERAEVEVDFRYATARQRHAAM